MTPSPTSPAPVLTLTALGRCVPLVPGQSLLEAARAAGLRLRSACRNGTCRVCLCRVTAGEAHLRYRVDWPGLSPEERAEGGWTLPCVALADGDVAIDATLDPRTAPR